MNNAQHPHQHGSHSTRLNLSRRPARRRLFVVLMCLLALFATVSVRLCYLQVFEQRGLASQFAAQRVHTVKLSSSRGTIFDRNGNDLAMSVPQQTIWADPSKVQDSMKTAMALSPLLDITPEVLNQKLSQKGRFVYLQRKASDDVAARVKGLKLDGVHMYEEPKRVFAGGSTLASVIGQVNVDNEGLNGLEKSYERMLAGSPGRMQLEQDLTGKDIPGGMREMTPATAGSDLMLTIDRELQNKVERALGDAVTRTNARGGIAAVMNVKTGEVLALSNLSNEVEDSSKTDTSQPQQQTSAPSASETRVGAARGSVVKTASHNMALIDVFEPGSVSKLVTIAGALEDGIVTPTTMFPTSDSMQIYDAKFKDAEPHPTYSWSTTDILTASSNIGTITIAQKLKKDRLDHYQRAFGYGSKTALNFPDESAGLIIPPKKYSGTTLATSAIGQGVSVTAMQMLAAYNVIANDGNYVAPKLVRATMDGKGKFHETAPSPVRNVISTKTAAQMNLMLQEVVRVGTATAAQVKGYPTGGKTGTAKKLASNNQGYKEGAYVSSFAGFAPANDPRFSAIVILDEPTPIYGGLVAAPVFAEISRYILQSDRVPPSNAQNDRQGVPHASPTASSAADETGVAGTTAEKAVALAENANGAKATDPSSAPSTSSPTSSPRPSTSSAPTTSSPKPSTSSAPSTSSPRSSG